MSLALLLPALIAQVASPPVDVTWEKLRALAPTNPVVTVSSRALSDEERMKIWKAANAGLIAEVPDLGAFRPFSADGRRIAIWDGFLLEERYALSTRALRRLGDIWRPGEVFKLEGETDLRQWLALQAPPSRYGKAPNNSPIAQIDVSAWITLRVGDRTVTDVSKTPPSRTADWPMPKTPGRPRPEEDKRLARFPATLVVSPESPYYVGESIDRMTLVGQTLKAWNKAQEEKLKASCAAFFKKREEALRAKFDGVLPIGRPVTSLRPKAKQELLQSLRSSYELYGFASANEIEAWAQKATITQVWPFLHALMPEYQPEGPSAVDFQITLP